MDRWNWFLSANFSGKWIITNGYAEVTRSENQIRAVLRYSPDIPPYAHVEAKCDETGGIEAIVESSDPETPSYAVHGVLCLQSGQEGEVTSIVLTDGYTVLGLAHGRRSIESNLA